MARLMSTKYLIYLCSLVNRNLKYCAVKILRNYEIKSCPSFDGGALILGAYVMRRSDGGTVPKLTETGERFNERTENRLMEFIEYAEPVPGLGEARILYGVDIMFKVIALVGLGDACLCYDTREQIDERKEAIRTAVGVGVRKLQKLNVYKIYVESFGHAESAAEGASMASWVYNELKNKNKSQLQIPVLELFDSNDWPGWQIGLHKASAQNLARNLMETPGNLLTPSVFAQSAVEILSKHAINVEVRMHNWAKLRNMNAFLAAGMGSCEPPVFLEIFYEGCNPNICPIVMIGKGITYNAGGICLKKKHNLKYQRGDMSGAAALVATLRAAAALQLPINIRGLIPLCVNTIGAAAMKPGDTVRAMNGKTIIIENTNHSAGLLMLADTLSYTKIFNPKFIVDIGTFTKGAYAAMGSSASLVYTNNDLLYETLRIASIHTGDRVWRFPLWRYYNEYVKRIKTADVTNLTVPGIGGEPGRSAAFLSEFVPDNTDWMHIDTYNLTRTSGRVFSYLQRGMAGRPTRTLIEFLAQLSCYDAMNKQTQTSNSNIDTGDDLGT